MTIGFIWVDVNSQAELGWVAAAGWAQELLDGKTGRGCGYGWFIWLVWGLCPEYGFWGRASRPLHRAGSGHEPARCFRTLAKQGGHYCHREL